MLPHSPNHRKRLLDHDHSSGIRPKTQRLDESPSPITQSATRKNFPAPSVGPNVKKDLGFTNKITAPAVYIKVSESDVDDVDLAEDDSDSDLEAVFAASNVKDEVKALLETENAMGMAMYDTLKGLKSVQMAIGKFKATKEVVEQQKKRIKDLELEVKNLKAEINGLQNDAFIDTEELERLRKFEKEVLGAVRKAEGSVDFFKREY